jgi:hypothetical protein
MPLKSGIVREYVSDIALFGGRLGDTTVALLGSSASMIGSATTTSADHSPFYYTLQFFNDVAELHAPEDHEPPYFSWHEAVEIGLRALPEAEVDMEFLARVIHTEDGLVVATPLYVALGSER